MQSNGMPRAAGTMRQTGSPRGVYIGIAAAVALAVGVTAGIVIREHRGGHSHDVVAQASAPSEAAAQQPPWGDLSSEQVLGPEGGEGEAPLPAAPAKVTTFYLVDTQDEAQGLQNSLDDAQNQIGPAGDIGDNTVLVVNSVDDQANARLMIKQAQLDLGVTNVRVDDLRAHAASGLITPVTPGDNADATPAMSPATDNVVPAMGGQAEGIRDASATNGAANGATDNATPAGGGQSDVVREGSSGRALGPYDPYDEPQPVLNY